MAKNSIRLQYSGFALFIAKLLSVATGLIFTLMLTRSLSKSDWGIWLNVSDVQLYFLLFATILPFWTMRFVARGREGAVKTGVTANLMISIVVASLYITSVPLITSMLGISEQYVIVYLVGAVKIVEIYLINALERCIHAKKPHILGYGLLIAEICKIVLGYILIVQLHLSLIGAMLSLIVAFAVQSLYYVRLLIGDLQGRIRWSYVKEWIKASSLNLYQVIGLRIAGFTLILLFIYGGEAARGYYGAASTIANVVAYSSFLSFALYPKLLAENSLEDITTSIRMVFMFAIPMTVGAIVLSDSLLTILRDVYVEARLVLVFLALNAFIMTLLSLLNSIILGVEKVDEGAKIPFKKLIKSKIFLVFTQPYIYSALTLPTAFYFLSNVVRGKPLEASIYIAAIVMLSNLATLIFLLAFTYRVVVRRVPWRSIGKYLFSSILMGVFLFLIPHPRRVTLTVAVTILGGLIYLAVTYLTDNYARDLLNRVLNEVKRTLRIDKAHQK